MKRILLKYFAAFFLVAVAIMPKSIIAADNNSFLTAPQEPDSLLPFPFKDDNGLSPNRGRNPLYLNDPSNITTTIEYDPVTNSYVLKKKIGDIDYRDPYYFDFEDYREFDFQKGLNDYWRERSSVAGADERTGLIPTINIRSEAFDRIFGSNTIDIRPQGTAELRFGVLRTYREDQNLDVRQRKMTSFDFHLSLQMSVMAKIGEKIQFNLNYNNEALNLELDNDFKLAYEGDEDEILQLIEAGNVTMPINSSLITGSQTLFGIKTKLQFGRLTLTGIVAKQNSTASSITVEGGAQNTEFKIKSSEYDENRHFFLSQYFRDNYEASLASLPIITSNVNITKIEVWVTNVGSAVTDNRNIVAFSDLGEHDPYNDFLYPKDNYAYPDNGRNTLMDAMDTTQLRDINSVYSYLIGLPLDLSQGRDFEKVESARKLSSTEYTYNSRLGFISLSSALTAGQVLAVAFQYTVNDEVYQVGEFSDQGITTPKSIVVKLLRSTSIDTRHPMWNLMMKNVYALNAYQVERSDFILNILYSGNENGVASGYFNEGPEGIKGVSLLKLFRLDSLDSQQNPIEGGDGIFDFIDGAATSGGTIQSANGRVFFPVLEPFGSYLHEILPTSMAGKYAYDSLYTQTKTNAKQLTAKDKFLLSGYYASSSGAEINLNAYNVPEGSVVVTAGGATLVENVDYTVDYVFGRVTIINEGILNSGVSINVSTESTSLTSSMQTQALLGLRADYLFSEHLNLGATLMHLRETPLTTKVAYGDEPIANTIWGLDLQFQKELPFITKVIDALPVISTKAPSVVSAQAEFAQFVPGHPKSIGSSGNSYIDDFESAKQSINLSAVGNWFLSSTPSYFPEASSGDLSYGFRRAKLAWYIIDPLFYGSAIPSNITMAEISNHYVRPVRQTELFPQSEADNNVEVNLSVFNLAYYPDERGPYNYNVDDLKEDGTLEHPEDKWGGIMRKMESTDFEANNIEYIEFWLMDPFLDPDDDGNEVPMNTKGGKLIFHLGDISEDILKDGRKSYEQGLPVDANVKNVDTTIWGRVPTLQALIYSFDSDPAARPYQDIGYDGLCSTRENVNEEYSFFKTSYIDKIAAKFNGSTTSTAYLNAVNDPSADDYHYFRGSDYDADNAYSSILARYKQYNSPEGNSCAQENTPEAYDISATSIPNMEDINNDNTLNESEKFYEYVVNLNPNGMVEGENYITDVYTANNIALKNGTRSSVTWYQFKIPINQPDAVYGVISDFTSIRFMRVCLTEFEEPVVLRFGSFELVKGDWRRYEDDLLAPGEYIPTNSANQTAFDVFTVSLEENGSTSERVPYVIPPGITRERDYSTTNQAQQDEQSMAISVNDLVDGDARGAYKTCSFDFRNYKNLKMFVHAHADDEAGNNKYANTSGAVTVFIRFGSDLTENYYEYEVPVTLTPWGTTIANDEAIWMDDNEINIEFEKIIQAKKNRKEAMSNENSTVSTLYPYSEMDGKNKITILGTPNISDVNAILIGVRNPKQTSASVNDDGLPMSVEVWVNELRLSNFNESAGWAATATLSANLADLGNVSVSGDYSTPGFGGIATSVSQRSQETVSNFYTSVNIDAGKFLPEKTGIKIPVHFDYSEEVSTPEYDPLDPDVYLKEQLANLEGEEKQNYKNKTQDISRKTNVNFINVRKEKTAADTKKPHFWDIENIDLSYAFSKTEESDIDIEYYNKIIHTAGLGYSYNANPKNIKPFSKAKFLRSKYLSLIRDFNFYYEPKSMSFRTNMDKNYIEKLLRNKTDDDIILKPTVSKQWNWNRNYVFKYDFATSLKFDYAANVATYIDEPAGLVTDKETYKQEVWKSVKDFGRMNTFYQTAGLNWTVPINKIPLLEWINMTAKYDVSYRWAASSLAVRETLGNTVENTANTTVTTSLRLTNLYNKIPYIKNLTKSSGTKQKPKPKPRPNDTVQTAKPKVNYGKIIGDGALKIIFGLKDVSLSYQGSEGTLIPGFYPEPDNFGYNWKSKAPTWGFILGSQADIREIAVANKWLTTDTLSNNQYAQTVTRNINMRANYEPFNGFKFEITASYRSTYNYAELFKADGEGVFHSYSPKTTGSYQVSYIMIKSAFSKTVKGEGDSNVSEFFELMKKYRTVTAVRLANENPNWNGNYAQDTVSGDIFPVGYGPSQQEVVMSALIAAYAGIDVNKVNLSTFPKIPLPNWNVQYNGLAKLPFLKKIFKNITLKHTYRCTYNIASYANNIYYESVDGYSSVFDDAGNFIPALEIGTVQVSEQLSPLIGVDVTLQNSLTANVQIKRTRTMSMSFTNNQLTDNNTQEYVFGVGYRFKNVKFSVRSLGTGKKKDVNSDLNIKLDFSIRNNMTVLRRLDEEVNQISSGQTMYSINASADYMISKNVTVALYYDQTINDPHLSSSIYNSTLSAGLSLRLTLAQ